MSEMIEGIVKFFLEDKGFGFVQCDDLEYFVHKSNIRPTGSILYKGQRVTFRLVDTQKGKMAVEVALKDD